MKRVSLLALEPEWIPELSALLLRGFPDPPHVNREFAEPEVLRWKYFDPRGDDGGPRSFVVRSEGRIVAHIGLCTTTFCCADPRVKPISTWLPIDWLSSDEKGRHGASLLMAAFARAETQYNLAASSSALPVLTAAGFKRIATFPVFLKAGLRNRVRCRREIYGEQRLPRLVAMWMMDFIQSMPFRNQRSRRPAVTIERVKHFGDEIRQVIERCKFPLMFTSRDPALLNHYLRHPKGYFSGWLVYIERQMRGFAILSVVPRKFARVGRIVECFLDSTDETQWTVAIHALEQQLVLEKAEIVRSFASTPWITAALRNNCFFRRGRFPFLVRDPHEIIPPGAPFHVTELEGDAGYL